MNRAMTVFVGLLACLLSAAALPDAVFGKTTRSASDPPPAVTWPLSRQKAALALIPFPWEQLHYKIVFLAPRKGFRAMTIESTHTIEVYARPKDDVQLVAFDIAHELGHAIDLTYNTNETRREWMKLRGIDPATTWFGCRECSDYNTPAGDFAETFALLLRGPEYFRGLIATPPSTAKVPTLRSFFPTGIFQN